MKKRFIEPKIEIINFSEDDIIVTSGTENPGDPEGKDDI